MHDWPSFQIQAGELLQHVSRTAYRHTPLHFGRNAANRYDDPARGYGVLYLGFELATALMESVFHKHLWLEAPSRAITLQEVRQRMVRVIEVMANIHLADVTAPGFMAAGLGMNLAQLACRDYAHTHSACRPRCMPCKGATASHCSTACFIHRATTTRPKASRCSIVRPPNCASMTTSTWICTGIGQISSRLTALAYKTSKKPHALQRK